MRISDWSSDVCSSDLWRSASWPSRASSLKLGQDQMSAVTPKSLSSSSAAAMTSRRMVPEPISWTRCSPFLGLPASLNRYMRSEEHTSELQSLMRISYAVFCLKKKKLARHHPHPQHT